MANGYCPALLRTIEEVAGDNAPSRKLHNAGFLAMLQCCANSTVNAVNDGYDDSGHERPLTVSYRRRPTLDDVQEEDNCDINRIPTKLEWNIPALNFASSSFYLSDEELRKYCEDASRTRSIGSPPSTIAQEHYELFKETANIVMKKVNRDLVTEMATQFGENVQTGSATGKVINIDRDGDQLILDNGLIDMLRDFQENEICGEPCLVGGGLFSAYEMGRVAACCNAAGFDLSRIGIPRFFFDKDTQLIWGPNSVGAFAPGSVKMIERMMYKGFFNRPKNGSEFFTAPLPIADFGCADPCQVTEFDVQLKGIDCPTEVEGPNGPITVNRGWLVIVSKRYGLWVQPDDAYPAGDELENTNGTLKYFFSNTASGGSSYPYAG